MADTCRNVCPAACCSSRAEAAVSVRRGAGSEPAGTTPHFDASVSPGGSTVPREDVTLHEAAACVYPSISAVRSSPSLSPRISEPASRAACPADGPALLIICVSPELLASPSTRRQRLERLQQSDRHFEQLNAQWQVNKKTVRKGEGDMLQQQLQGHPRAAAAQTPVAPGSRVSLPEDSAAYIFLAAQFLPSLGLPMSFSDASTVRGREAATIFSTGLPVRCGDGNIASEEEAAGASFDASVSLPSAAHTQQQMLSLDRVANEQQLLVAEQRQQKQQPPQQEESETQLGPPRPREGPTQPPRLRDLPTGCLLRTKYYEAPLRIVYQFFHQAPKEEADVVTPNFSSPAAVGGPSPSQHFSSGELLHLAAPPEAVLLLCSKLAHLYRAHELVATAAQQGCLSDSEFCGWPAHEEAAAGEALATNGDPLPLPRLFGHPPYILLRRDFQEADCRTVAAGDQGKAAELVEGGRTASGSETGGVTTGANGISDGIYTFPGGTQGMSETVEEGKPKGGNWLSSVPVKLLVCFDAEEEDTDASRDTRERSDTHGSNNSFLLQPNANADDEEDPSAILFFEDSSFLEKVSLPIPCRRLPDGGVAAAATEANAPAGGAATSAASRERQTADGTEGPQQTPSSPFSVHPLLGATMPLLQRKGMDNGSTRALQRLVEALHCHMWPSMRLLKNSKPGGKAAKVFAHTTGQQHDNGRTVLPSRRENTAHRDINEAVKCISGGRNDAEAIAGQGCIDGERGVAPSEQKRRVLLAGATTSEGATAATGDVTPAAAGDAKTEPARGTKQDATVAGGAAVAAAVATTGGGSAATTGEDVAAPSNSTRETSARPNTRRKDGKKAREEMPLQALESLARTMREMRLEAHRLPHAERTAKAEALTLQLAEALGVSDDEEDD